MAFPVSYMVINSQEDCVLTYSDILVMPGEAIGYNALPQLGGQRGIQLPFASSVLQKLTTASLMTQVRNNVACLLEKSWSEGRT